MILFVYVAPFLGGSFGELNMMGVSPGLRRALIALTLLSEAVLTGAVVMQRRSALRVGFVAGSGGLLTGHPSEALAAKDSPPNYQIEKWFPRGPAPATILFVYVAPFLGRSFGELNMMGVSPGLRRALIALTLLSEAVLTGAVVMQRRSALRVGFVAGSGGLLTGHPSEALAAKDSPPNYQIEKWFPGALKNDELDDALFTTLKKHGYTPQNTLLGHSTCPDEVNAPLVDMLRARWGEGFALGGLGGLPFAGKAGLGAYAHHCPQEGKLLIVIAPHVGVGTTGKVGKIERIGQLSASSACGAAVGAYNGILARQEATAKGQKVPNAAIEGDDIQIGYIVRELEPRIAEIERSRDDIAFVTYQMYRVARDAIIRQIRASPGVYDDATEVAVLGGIQINRKGGDDYFQPLMLKTYAPGGESKDYFSETFGSLPRLEPILGSDEAADRVTIVPV